MVGSFFGAEQLKNQLSEMPSEIWIVGQKATDVLINNGYSGKIATYSNSSELVKLTTKATQNCNIYGAERTIQDWNKHGIAHIITYRNSPKPPRLARQHWMQF